jgi:hypothetical protein
MLKTSKFYLKAKNFRIDTFGDLRSAKQEKDYTLRNTCFICGLDRSKFDNQTVSFDEHVKSEHNMWNYCYFLILIKVKDKTEFTGPESYVYSCIQVIFFIYVKERSGDFCDLNSAYFGSCGIVLFTINLTEK